MEIFKNFLFYTILMVYCIIKLSWAIPLSYSNEAINNEELSRVNKVMKEKFKSMKFILDWTDEEKEEYDEMMMDKAFINSYNENFKSMYDTLEPNGKIIYDALLEIAKKDIPEFSFIATLNFPTEVMNDNAQFSYYFDKYVNTGLITFIIDYPEYWWTYTYNNYDALEFINNNNIYELTLNFTLNSKIKNYTPTEIRDKNIEVVRMKNNLISRIKSLGFKTDYGKLKYIHDFIIYRNRYKIDENLKFIRTPYGALVDNISVCQGYAEAFQLISKEIGIDCIIGRSSSHEWNFSKFNNKWYVVDVTWDDTVYDKAFYLPEKVVTTYFLMGTNDIAYDNIAYINETSHKLVFNWFYRSNGKNDDYLTYPLISSEGYEPTEEDLEDIEKINESSFLFDQLPSCFPSNCTLENKATLINDNFCIGKEDKKIYKGEGGKCKLTYGNNISDEGIVIFNIESYANNTLVDISSTEEVITEPSFALYDCAYGECYQTYGYTRYNKKIYYHSTSTGTIEATSITKCDESTVGKIKYDDESIQICVLKNVDISSEGKTNLVYTFVDAQDYSYYHVVSDNILDYSNSKKYIELIKTNPNIIAYAQINPQLPKCDSQCKLDITGEVINEGESCINKETIYQYNSNICKKLEDNGVKVFQKNKNFNSYIDVTDTLDTLSIATNELTPTFVVYDCNSSKCTQSSGYIKYKLSQNSNRKKRQSNADYNFVNCYKHKNTDNSHAFPFVGCIPFNKDNSKNKACTSTKAKYNTYIYDDSDSDIATLQICFSPKIEEQKYKYITIDMNKNSDGIFMFTNYDTQFPNTLKDNQILVKVNKNWVVKTNEIKAGTYKNSGRSYTDIDDEIITCKDSNISNCEITIQPASTTSVSKNKETTSVLEKESKESHTSTSNKSSTKSEEPTSSTSNKPSTNSEEPTITSNKSSTKSEKPTSTSSTPSTKSEEPTSTSSTPSTKSEKPTSTSSIPSIKSEKPTSTSSIPSTKFEEPTSTNSTPSTNSKEPTSTSSTPSTKYEKPTSTSSISSTKSEKPTSTSSIPSTKSEEPTSTSSTPSTKSEELTSTSSTPSTKYEKPTSTNSTPSTKSEKPTSTSSIPSTKSEEPTSTNSTPSTKSEKPTSTSSIPSTKSEKPTSTSSIPSTKSEKPTSTSSTPSTKSEEPTSTNSTPSTKYEKPTSTNSTPSTKSEKPTSTSSTPSTKYEKPTSTNSTPSTKSEKPTSTSNTPSTKSEEPTSTNSTPSTNSKEPTSTSSTPSTKYEKPTSSTSNKPSNILEEPTSQSRISSNILEESKSQSRISSSNSGEFISTNTINNDKIINSENFNTLNEDNNKENDKKINSSDSNDNKETDNKETVNKEIDDIENIEIDDIETDIEIDIETDDVETGIYNSIGDDEKYNEAGDKETNNGTLRNRNKLLFSLFVSFATLIFFIILK